MSMYGEIFSALNSFYYCIYTIWHFYYYYIAAIESVQWINAK